MSLKTRIERLENQFFPPTPKNSLLIHEFLLVYYLEYKYGDKVEQNISGIKLYQYRLLRLKMDATFAAKAAHGRRASDSPKSHVASHQTPRGQNPSRDDSMNPKTRRNVANPKSRRPSDFGQIAKSAALSHSTAPSRTGRAKP